MLKPFIARLTMLPLLFGITLQASETVVTTIDNIHFTHPSGVTVQKVAGEPEVRWPIAAIWNADATALYVLECRWNGESVQDQLKSRPHRIVRLVDEDGDGIFEHSQSVADQLSFPEGIALFGESLLVAAPPAILKLDDVDHDGFFETHSVWHDGGTVTHCANDLHGPMIGPDGWVYWTKGAFAEQTLLTRDGGAHTSRASHLYRRHPNQPGVEVLMTGGMDNPVDVTFLPNGERLFCSTFLHHPADGVRDGIAHAIYGSMFGKPHNVLDGHRRTGDLLAPICELGPAAPAAIETLRSRELIEASKLFASDARDANVIVSAQFNLQRIGIHQLASQGASYATISKDLVSADRIDFHPTDVIENRDGSLLVIDTGGWYDLCCPSSGVKGQVAPGGIYQVSAKLAKSDASDRALDLNAAPQTLASQLRDAGLNPSQRVELFWALARTLVNDSQDPLVRTIVIESLSDSVADLRHAACNVVSLYRWPEAAPQLNELLQHGTPMDQRLAAECLGRLKLPGDEVVQALMQAVVATHDDRALEHAVLYAIMQYDQPAAIRRFLSAQVARQRWAAWMMLDQTGQIQRTDASHLLVSATSPDPSESSLAMDVLGRNVELAPAIALQLDTMWKSDEVEKLVLLERLVPKLVLHPDIKSLVTQWLARAGESRTEKQALLLRVVSSFHGRQLPVEWVDPLARWLDSVDTTHAIEVARALSDVKWDLPRDKRLVDSLLARITTTTATIENQLPFVSALPNATAGVQETLQLELVANSTSENESLASECLTSLGHVQLTPRAARDLAARLGDLPPLQVQVALIALLRSSNGDLDAEWLAILRTLPAAKVIHAEAVLSVLRDRSASKQDEWRAFFKELHAPPEEIDRAVETWMDQLDTGDPVRGLQVFRSATAACSACHRVGYVGGKLGPELTRIGQSRTRRDLVAAILFPSARIEQGFQATKILTLDGRMLSGFVAHETPTHVELVCGVNERCVIEKSNIEQREPSDVSLMPAGLEKSLSREELADLIAFLEAAR